MQSGGAERVAATLCNAWAARGDSVMLVPTFSGGGRPFYPLDTNIHLIYLADLIKRPPRLGSKQYLARIRALRSLVKESNPDVVISFLTNVNLAALAATAFTGIPCVIGERSTPFRPSLGVAWRAACKIFYRFADCVTVQTETSKQMIRRRCGGLSNVAVIPNPLPSGISQWQATPGIPRQRYILLSLGRLSPEKQIGQIIHCFNELAPEFPDWDLDIWGDGPERSTFQAQIDSLGLSPRVRLRGLSDHPFQVMAGADIFVMNSRYEGFPNALLEAMAVGLPCVASDCLSGPRDISNGGRNALLFQPNNHAELRAALARLMQDAPMRAALSLRARSSILDRYSLDEVLKRWDSIIVSSQQRYQ